MASATVESATVKAAGQESTVTVAPALRPACPRMEQSAAGAADASAASASALFPKHLGTSVRSVPHAEMPVALQGENTFMPSPEKDFNSANVM